MEGWLEVLGRPDGRKESWECDAILFQLIVYFLKKYFFEIHRGCSMDFLISIKKKHCFFSAKCGCTDQ